MAPCSRPSDQTFFRCTPRTPTDSPGEDPSAPLSSWPLAVSPPLSPPCPQLSITPCCLLLCPSLYFRMARSHLTAARDQPRVSVRKAPLVLCSPQPSYQSGWSRLCRVTNIPQTSVVLSEAMNKPHQVHSSSCPLPMQVGVGGWCRGGSAHQSAPALYGMTALASGFRVARKSGYRVYR